jgi:formamidopyrimidine-DNA glycosylase
MTAPPEPRGEVRMRLSTADVTIDLSGPTACTVDPPDERASIVARLGPDPLRRDGAATAMIDKMSRSGRRVGDLLMDQAVVAGVGNVYRAEVLFVRGIHPERPGRDCTADELGALWETVRSMLRAGVRAGRIVTVQRSELSLGRGARIPRSEATYVYKRDRCLRCGDAIRTVDIAGRTCYYCPTDQPH